GLLEDLRALLARVSRSLDPRHRVQPPLRSFFTFFASLAATPMDLRKPRLRFDDFFSRLWLLIACRRRSFPAPLSLKRFFALRDVFIFGIGLYSPNPYRGENP